MVFRSAFGRSPMIFLLFVLDQWGLALAPGIVSTGTFANDLVAGMAAFAVIVLFLFGRPHRVLSGPAFWLVIALFVYAFMAFELILSLKQAGAIFLPVSCGAGGF